MSEISLGVYPPVIRIKSNAEAKVNLPVTVLNNSENSIQVTITLKPFYDSGKTDGSVSYYAESDAPGRDLDFLKVVKIKDNDQEIKTINLYPKEYKTLNLDFITPKSFSSDYYFSVVFSLDQTKNDSKETISYVKPSAAINVLLSGDNFSSFAVIEELKTDKVQFSGPIKIDLTVKNASDHYESISGTIVLFDTFGNPVDKADLSSEIILAGATRKMREDGSKSGIDLGNKFMLGLYTARAEIKSEGKIIKSQETRILTVPLIVMLIVIIALFIILGITAKVLKKINHLNISNHKNK